MWKQLNFYRNFDWNLNAEQDQSGVWQATVHLDEVSTGLYETVNLFILQRVLVTFYIDPANPAAGNTPEEELLNRPMSPVQSLNQVTFRWQGDPNSSEDIFIYTSNLDESGRALINTVDSLTLETGQYVATNQDGSVPISQALVDNTALQVNIAIMSQTEGVHQRVLEMVDSAGTVHARIKFYGEVVGEDERLKILLGNFGATLNETDFILFKEHDISEMAPDQILLNRKRRELLLELSNIKPFVGTYKAILNAIDFFGYSNLTLKEYWVNLDKNSAGFGKLKAIPVPNSSQIGNQILKSRQIEKPSSTLKKTSKFSLVYRLNLPDGGADQWDIPTVEEVFDYTPDEVLIKLYGLKNKLQKEYMPINARIIDIVGEGDFFAQKNLNFWNNQNHIQVFNEGHKIKFKVFPENRPVFIEDLHLLLKPLYDQYWDPTSPDPLDNPYHNLLNLDWSNFDQLDSTQISQLRETIQNFYLGYYNQPLDTFNPDIPIGAPVILDGRESLPDTWDSAQFYWNDVLDTSGITWNNWWKRYVYEIEWVIEGPRGYSESFRGTIDDYLNFPVWLPYNGKYSVEMRMYDLYGHRSYDKIEDFIDVRLKEIELYGIYRWLDNTPWRDRDENWNDVGGYWNIPTQSSTIVDETIASYYLTLDRANYIHDETQGVGFSTVSRYFDEYSETGFNETAGPYQWSNCQFRWNDGEHNWWDATRVAPDMAASFRLSDFDNGSVIQITVRDPETFELQTEQIEIQIDEGLGAIERCQAAAEWLNAYNSAIAQKFNWNPVILDLDGDGQIEPGDDEAVGAIVYILAVGKGYSYNYDFVEVIGIDCTITGQMHPELNNPGYDDVRIFRDWCEVERSTHITMSVDISKAAGLKQAKWVLTNKSYPEANDIYYNDMWLTYIFQYPGWWSIEFTAEDTNGNVNTTFRNMIKVK